MKRIFLLSVVVALVNWGCSNDSIEAWSTENQGPITRLANETNPFECVVNEECMKFENNQYIILIDKAEALRRGLNESEYEQFIQGVEEGNKMLREMVEKFENDPEIKSYIIEDFSLKKNTENVDPIGSIPLVKSFSETEKMPSGVLSTIGQEVASDSFWAPASMKSVSCHCYANTALFANHSISVTTQGQSHSGSKWMSGSVTVPLAASNTSGTISYHTSDSNGGRCSWRGEK